MTADAAKHPPKDLLIAFGQGKLAETELSQVEDHLGVCPQCCETLLDLKDDTFVGLVRLAKEGSMPSSREVMAEPAVQLSGTAADQNGQVVARLDDAAARSATMLVSSGHPLGTDDLPDELAEHPRYRIVELIGRGGMGNVYRAEHRLMNRAVAIKVINSQLVRQPQAVERFRREVQAAAKLSHPNIVAAYDAEQAGDVHFLVMEFVEGTDLASIVKQRGPMSVAEACECVGQAATGLQHAYEKGMVHRDIKPHNLMRAARGRVRILDFGLAGFASEAGGWVNEQAAATVSDGHPVSGSSAQPAAHLTTLGSVMGTPDYMAPEQAVDAHSADIRADIYSLGCTLHFLLTGKPPFDEGNVIEKLKAHAQEPPPSLTTLRRDVPPELARVVTRMLAKDPASRFQTPAEVVTALAPFTQVARQNISRIGKLIAAAVLGITTLLAGVIVVVTNRGRLEISSPFDDVKVSVKQDGQQVELVDLKSGSQVRWLPSGDYELELIGRETEVQLDKNSLRMTRLGQAIVTATWKPEVLTVVKAFNPSDKPIAGDVVADDGGWKITTQAPRSVPLFEVPNPNFDTGPFYYRAKLKTENVTGHAYLEMWSRFPGMGEFFSKGLNKVVSGTNGWAEYEIPFLLQKGQQPDLVKLNVTIEGAGTVWIKDIELRGKVQGRPVPTATTNQIASGLRSLGSAFSDLAQVTAHLNDPRNNRGGSVPVALLAHEGRAAFRFANWFVVFEGIACDPLPAVLGFSNFNVPQPGTSGEGTVDFGAGNKLPGVLIKYKFANDTNEVSINNHRFKLKGKATRLEFDDKAYDSTNSLQTILVARDGSTRLQAPPAPDAIVEVGRFTGHEGGVSHAIFSPGGRYGISCGSDKTIRVWDIATQEEKRVLKGHEGWVFGLAISTDGRMLASCDNKKSIRLWNLETGEQVGELTGHTDAATDLAFMPDRTHLLSAGLDETLRLWHVADRKLVRTINIGTRIENVLPLPDGRRVVLSGAHTRGWGPRIYDLEKGEKIDASPNGDSCMAVTNDGRMLLIGDITGVLRVTDTDKNNLIVQMKDPRANVARDAGARDAAITPDGRFAITTTREHHMYLWDLHGGKLLSSAQGDTIGTIALSPDGRFALTIGQGGVSVWRLPESALEPIGTVPARVGAKAEVNLLTDPSFENTPLTQLPEGWRGWLNDGQQFRCEVVAGGHTDQRCLKISGKGVRGVVFANDIKADRSKRYALKGWAKFEGDQAARAIIKFNYFRGSEFLGAHDLVGAMADQPGWHFFEKTDALDAYPTADHFYAMCHVEGSGTGWFDELELVAYDRGKLPKDFDARHGRHNRLHGPNSLRRWVGTWDVEYAIREFDNSLTESKLSMMMVSEQTLSDYFLTSYAKSLPVEGQESPATPRHERLQFLLFDQNLGAFRQWMFKNQGNVVEWRGPWNNDKQTLELRALPDASNLHSREHFVDDDHIEATLRLQYVMGQREAGRWTATRKALDGKVDVPIAKTHVDSPAELSQLNKFAGEWTIHATYKPSVWNPQQREETALETSHWILGGRFLMTRAFNEQGQLTSIWLATYESSEKSNRFWFFNADGSSGEWRLTWDEMSRSFQLRAIDMPQGWVGSGINRWVNEDAFNNEALIKDENGRVLLDSTQERQRKK